MRSQITSWVITARSGHMNITVDYHQTNRKVDTGKTLKRWPVLVDHYNYMTAVVKWLLSIPYLATFTDLLKKAGVTILNRKSSFSTIHTVSSAEPAFKTSKYVSQDFTLSSYTPYKTTL